MRWQSVSLYLGGETDTQHPPASTCQRGLRLLSRASTRPQHRLGHDRRSGLVAARDARRPYPADTALGRHGRGERRNDAILRVTGLRSDARRAHDGPVQLPHRGSGHLSRKGHDASRRDDHRGDAAARRVSDGNLRQVASRRQLPPASDGPRISRVRPAQGRRHRAAIGSARLGLLRSDPLP